MTCIITQKMSVKLERQEVNSVFCFVGRSLPRPAAKHSGSLHLLQTWCGICESHTDWGLDSWLTSWLWHLRLNWFQVAWTHLAWLDQNMFRRPYFWVTADSTGTWVLTYLIWLENGLGLVSSALKLVLKSSNLKPRPVLVTWESTGISFSWIEIQNGLVCGNLTLVLDNLKQNCDSSEMTLDSTWSDLRFHSDWSLLGPVSCVSWDSARTCLVWLETRHGLSWHEAWLGLVSTTLRLDLYLWDRFGDLRYTWIHLGWI